MYHIRFGTCAILCGLALSACRTLERNESGLKGVFESQAVCIEAPPQRLDAVRSLVPAGFLVGFDGAGEAEMLQALATLSNDTLAWLFEQFSTHALTIRNMNTGDIRIDGATELNDDGTIATSVIIHPALVSDFRVNVILHELGHVLQLRASTPEFEARLKQVFTNEGKSWFVGRYAKSDVVEYFAEAFNTFNCSPESLKRMSEKLPATYALLRSSVSKPFWADELPPAAANPPNVAVASQPFYKDHFSLGVTTEDDSPTAIGIRVTQVTPGSSADRAGIKVGDKLTSIMSFQNLLKPEDLELFVASTNDGMATISIERPAGEIKIKLQLDVLSRAMDMNDTGPPDLGACRYSLGSQQCSNYRTRSVCNRMGSNTASNQWAGGQSCATAFP